MKPTLYIFAGLPGAGKTTVAQRVAQKQSAAYLRIDTVEQAIKDCCSIPVETEGYRLACRIAQENLAIGINVVVDSCNSVTETRNSFEGIARDCDSGFLNIEVVCSDTNEHRIRIETRTTSTGNIHFLTWEDVVSREYHEWDRERIVIDTAGKSVSDAFQELSRTMIHKMSKPNH